MRDDLIAADGFDCGFKSDQRFHRRVRNLSASNATHMIVIFNHSIKALLASAELELPNQATLAQHFEVPVDRAEADSRKFAPNKFIEFTGGGMSEVLLQLFQDDSALASHPQNRLRGDFLSCRRHNMIIVIIRM
jgi:hypothetical protein